MRALRGDMRGEVLGEGGNDDAATTAASIDVGVDGRSEEHMHGDIRNGKGKGGIMDVGVIGGRKKKKGFGPKVVAIVEGDDGGDVDVDVEDDREGVSARKVKGKRKVMILKVDSDSVAGKKEEIKVKVKKKGKKIKLSFDEDGVE